MNTFDRSWDRLGALARRVASSDAVADAAPLGFATRVAAEWIEARRQSGVSLWEWLAVRALVVACVLTALAAFASWPAVNTSLNDDALADVADPLDSEVLPL